MARRSAPERAVQGIAARCHAGLDAAALQNELVERLAAIVPFDAVFLAAVDPASLLFTSAVTRGIPQEAAGMFLANEFFADDVNKFRTLASGSRAIDWLDRLTDGQRAASARYRDVMEPIGYGDELRAAFRSGGECWGFICLHREDGPSGFTETDARRLKAVLPHIGEGLRRAVLVDAATNDPAPDAPGVLILDDERRLLATTDSGAQWLWELTDPDIPGRLPLPVEVVVARLELLDTHPDVPARVRVRTRSGHWVVVHAAYMDGLGNNQVAVVVEPAKSAELAPLILAAYGLTRREAEVAQLALRGMATKTAARSLGISEHTVEDHLKSVFTKVGVTSRGELTARIFTDHFVH